MPAAVDNLALVKGILDHMLSSGDLRPLLDGLADDVVFTVATPDDGPDTYQGAGKAAVLDYFVNLGDLIAFWRVTYSSSGARVLVRGEESFTLQPGGLEAHSEFALLFDLRDGLITRLLVVEDPPVLPAEKCLYACHQVQQTLVHQTALTGRSGEQSGDDLQGGE
jgi:ketosteroid isomerase-like protein